MWKSNIGKSRLIMDQELIFHVFSSSQSKLVVFGLLVGADHLL